MRYNEDDRLRVSQDGNLRAKKQWISYSYDALGRIKEQSLAAEIKWSVVRPLSDISIGGFVKPQEPPYLGTSVPLRKYVYDTYPSEVQAAGLDFRPIEGLTASGATSLRYDNASGALTYEKLAVLENDTISGYHQRAYYYDYKGRVIQTVERDAEDGILCTSRRYDFVGNIIAQRESYTRAGTTDRIDRTFSYDDRSRLLSETSQVNGGELAVVGYEYDELGRLSARRLGEGQSAIAEQSEYDIRSWLTAKSSLLFSMSLGHSPTGNITSWQWQHKGDPSGDGPQNRYDFTYDGLARLKNTDQYVNGALNKQNVERFLSYDRNGNLLTLIRYADSVQTSNRRYIYSGNRLERMEKDKVIAWDEIEVLPGGPVVVVPGAAMQDNGASALRAGISVDTSDVVHPVDPGIFMRSRYAHDRNGNLTYDMELETNFAYNSLNLLEKATRNDTIVAKYSYLADGTKLSAVNADDCGFAYRGSFTYRADAGGDRVFESTPFGGGRIVTTADKETVARYFLTDHLGSVRVVATDQNNVIEHNDYYPFGKRWDNAALPVSDNRDRFNGKEDQVFIGDCLADYGARCYNKLNGRWLAQDPLAEKYCSISQYGYCNNNPISAIDWQGKLIIFINGYTPYKSQQGAHEYWQETVNGKKIDLAQATMEQLNDNNVLYRHGGNSPIPSRRMLRGKQQAASDFDSIIKSITDSDGTVQETIKVITHSMGAAYGKGYVKELKRLLKENGYGKSVLISLVADFDPYQANHLAPVKDVFTMQFTHDGFLADYRQWGLDDDNYFENPDCSSHAIVSFINEIMKLEEGTYAWDGEKWVRQN